MIVLFRPAEYEQVTDDCHIYPVRVYSTGSDHPFLNGMRKETKPNDELVAVARDVVIDIMAFKRMRKKKTILN